MVYHGKLPTGVKVENFTRELTGHMYAGILPVYCRYSTGAGKEHLSGHVTWGTYQILAIALPHFLLEAILYSWLSCNSTFLVSYYISTVGIQYIFRHFISHSV